MDSRAVEMWTVTWRPNDLPGVEYAARLHRVLPNNQSTATDSVVTGATLEKVHAQLPPGLHRLERDPNDDPVIVEIWL